MKKIIIIVAVVMIVAVSGILAVMFFSQSGAVSAGSISQLSIGEKYLSDLNYEQAVVTLENVIEVEPNNAEAYVSLAKAYAFMGDLDTAYEILEKGYNATGSTIIQREIDRLFDTEETIIPVTEELRTVEISGRTYPINTTELVLRDCGLTDDDLEQIAKLTDLERLDISNNGITDISTLVNLTSLKKFYAGNNSISDISPLAKIPSLEYVGLRNNKISNADALLGSDNLKYLHLTGNQIAYISEVGDDMLLLYLAGNSIRNTSAITKSNLLYCDI